MRTLTVMLATARPAHDKGRRPGANKATKDRRNVTLLDQIYEMGLDIMNVRTLNSFSEMLAELIREEHDRKGLSKLHELMKLRGIDDPKTLFALLVKEEIIRRGGKLPPESTGGALALNDADKKGVIASRARKLFRAAKGASDKAPPK